MKHALITGVTGQDGSYLAELLLSKDYHVFGLVRRSSTPNYQRIQHLLPRLQLLEGNLADQASLLNAVKKSMPDEIYNLGAMTYVPASWDEPIYTADVTGVGVVRLLEAMREVRPDARFYQASSSEMFGKVRETPQTELTPFYPRSPYGVAKAYAHYATVNYRESYNMFACCGICFNHESPRRGLEFVTRKITHAAASIKLGRSKTLALGNLDAKRDWGYAGDYVMAMWMMLQHDEPADYVIATGQNWPIRYLLETAFGYIGLNWRKYVAVDERYKRPAEVHTLLGDSTKIRERLGWRPRMSFESMVRLMVDEDIKLLKES